MPLQSISQAPQPNIALSRSDTDKAGVAYGFEDDYQQMQMAKYNNEYNYWLWQQQAEYNSPKEQMERAKQAGLNPNVVAGNVSSGNLSNTPQSNARASGNINSSRIQLANVGINSFNSLLKAIGEGIDATSKISNIPHDISGFRKMLTEYQRLSNEYQGYKNRITEDEMTISSITKLIKSFEYSGIIKNANLSPYQLESLRGTYIPDYLLNPVQYDASGNAYSTFKDSPLLEVLSKQALIPGQKYSLNKEEINKIQEEIKELQEKQNLTKSQSEYTSHQNSLFDVNTYGKLGVALLSILARGF